MKRKPSPWEAWHDDLAALMEACRAQGGMKAAALSELKQNGKTKRHKQLWSMYYDKQRVIDGLRDSILGVTLEEN